LLPTRSPPPPTDEDVARRVLAGETELFELVMRRHNQRVYRTVRSILKDEDEVEDAMQQAYVQAYTHLGQFAGHSRFSTWLIRIALNEALGRLRRGRKLVAIDDDTLPEEEASMSVSPAAPTPEDQAASRELGRTLEDALDALPDIYRTVLVLREVEGMTTAETADTLETSEEVVKTRLHRAKRLLHDRLATVAAEQMGDTFAFHARRCDRVVSGVMARILRR
jgi:RNA polymerase sigma-70 factor, ECF subfamily